MLYSLYQTAADVMLPMRLWATAAGQTLAGGGDLDSLRAAGAMCEMLSRARLTHRRPSFGIDAVEVDTNFGNHSIQGEQPRTAVGVIGTNHLVFVVVDGRDTGYSRGASLDELAQIMISLGATTAYNLDGGGSSEMWFGGEVVNRPSNGGERGTSDILAILGADS